MIENGDLLRRATTYCFVTCIYIPATVILLAYFNNLYNIGKYSSYKLLLGLIFVEYVKCSTTYSTKTNTSQTKAENRKNVKCRSIIKSTIIILSTTFVYYFISVLFGAQVFAEQEETLMFSCLLCVLTVIPACINLGAEATLGIFTNLTMNQGDLICEIMLRNVQFTLGGAWLGAFVIPLDWDRDWQKWPVPCCLGALTGFVLSHVFTLSRIVLNNSNFLSKKTGKYYL